MGSQDHQDETKQAESLGTDLYNLPFFESLK